MKRASERKFSEALFIFEREENNGVKSLLLTIMAKLNREIAIHLSNKLTDRRDACPTGRHKVCPYLQLIFLSCIVFIVFKPKTKN